MLSMRTCPAGPDLHFSTCTQQTTKQLSQGTTATNQCGRLASQHKSNAATIPAGCAPLSATVLRCMCYSKDQAPDSSDHSMRQLHLPPASVSASASAAVPPPLPVSAVAVTRPVPVLVPITSVTLALSAALPALLPVPVSAAA